MWGTRKNKRRKTEINPEDIFIDSSNLPAFDKDQFEGRIERPIDQGVSRVSVGIIVFLFLVLLLRAGDLQVLQGKAYAKRALENQLNQQIIFADRGDILDRNGLILASDVRANLTDDFAQRVYVPYRGLGNLIGYVQPPAKDSSGVYYRSVFVGMDGIERAYNTQLSGRNGMKLTETDAQGNIVSQSEEQAPQNGTPLTLSIDANLTQALYDDIAKVATKAGYQGGAGVIMDVHTGQILAITSYPEYSSQAMTDGNAAAIAAYNANLEQPFLNRAGDGLYAPGSIVKPIIGIAALDDGVIGEYTKILSTGSISIPNPFDPAHPSVFLDWRPNGWVDMRHAIAVSSDVYFYEVGGGYQNQPGIGISQIDKYFKLFGFGTPAGLANFSEPSGSIPSPAWKAQNFPKDPIWRIGDTYHTTIGQYGLTVTPLQIVKEAAAIANGGILVTPTLLASSTPQEVNLSLPEHNIEVVREGMRLGVTSGISQEVNLSFIHVAAKTGTAQLGVHNAYENSWMMGFFPYENPQYAYAIVLEKVKSGTLEGAPRVAKYILEWMHTNAPQYLQ